MPSIRLNDVPGRDTFGSYRTARKHFDSVKPWNSKYNPDGDERPIGKRAIKADSGVDFNYAMRLLRDESVAFRLYNTDCVVWHPDDTLTVHGWASMSTNEFIRSLTPQGISQSCRHEMYNGRRGDAFDPVLHLMPLTERWYSSDYRYPDVRDRKVVGTDWRSGIVVNCDGPVRLHYNAAQKHWVPSEPDALDPFRVPRIDRKAAREVSRQYNLATLNKVLNAVVALAGTTGYVSQRTAGAAPMGEIMNALEQERYVEAISMFPRGYSFSFGRYHGTETGIRPGFVKRLRDHIYDHEGVVTYVDEPILTPAQYRRYIADSKRFD
jgi:hypothetical protein